MKKKSTIIITILYTACILALLLYFNGRRSEEYTYTADLAGYTAVSEDILRPDGSLYIDDSSGFSGEFAYSTGLQLLTGSYDITIDYRGTADNTLHLSADSNYEEYIALPATQNSVTVSAAVFPSSDNFRIWLIYNGSGSLQIDSVTVSSDSPLYRDYDYFMILTAVFGILIPLAVFYLAKKKKYTRSDWIQTGILAVLAVLVNYPVFFGYLWLGVDMRGHLMRITGVSSAIEAGRFPAILYSNMCNGYGELSCVYPDIFLYIPGFLRSRGVSFIAAYDTVHVLINTAALVIMYCCVRYLTKEKIPAFVAAVMYCFVPYRLTPC